MGIKLHVDVNDAHPGLLSYPGVDVGIFNWSTICGLIGVQCEKPYGELDPQMVRIVLHNCILALNTESILSQHTQQYLEHGNFALGKVTVESIKQKLVSVSNLLLFASKHRLRVYWL
mgnify:FL=1